VLRYQSGEVLRVPASNNNLLRQLGRGPENNPATWGGGTTLFNRVAGEALVLKDPNCHCIDPTKDLVLNPKAWVDAPPGQFGTTAPYLNDYRWQRQPSESMSLARNFFVNRERNVKFEVRAEGSGRAGDVVAVRNVDSGKTFRARILRKGWVAVE